MIEICVTEGMRGHYAVMYDTKDMEPIQTGESFATCMEAAENADIQAARNIAARAFVNVPKVSETHQNPLVA